MPERAPQCFQKSPAAPFATVGADMISSSANINYQWWAHIEAVELVTLESVSWFNHHRLLEPLGYIPPAEAEANYYKQLSS